MLTNNLPVNIPPLLPSGPDVSCFKFVPRFHSFFHGSPALLADCCSIMSVLSGSDHLSNVYASYTIPSFFIIAVKAVDFNLNRKTLRLVINIKDYSMKVEIPQIRGYRGRDRLVVGFTTTGSWIYNTYAISAYHHLSCEFESRSGRGVQHYVIKFVSFLRVLRFPPLIKLTATI